MTNTEHSQSEEQVIEQLLGYLNFSSGTADASFLANLNHVWEPAGESSERSSWQLIGKKLGDHLQALHRSSPAFQDIAQATAVLSLALEELTPAYKRFHEDLLFHQGDEQLSNAFFLGRIFEAVLGQGGPWTDTDRIVAGGLRQLNDYLGYRPVPVLESRKIEVYAHERVRPVPLYVRDAGVAKGPYAEVVALSLEMLGATDDDLLRSAYFDPQALEELSFDPRAYDFDHPVNKRPNYHFGQWDPHQIDNQGRYTRFVVQQVTLDALMQRIVDVEDLPHEQLLFEAAGVLAGTILMASGISGSGPDSHDSTTTLSNLLPRIAAYRDEFYERLIDRTEHQHAQRLRDEAIAKRQPFGSARQHLNAQLARCRASQLEHVQLAKLFARMGYPEAAAEQAAVVPVASARTLCEIDCRVAAVKQAIEAQELDRAVPLLGEIVERLHRGIECGAIVDPWSILGFDAQFSLFPALENSVHDHRVDELIDLIEQVFSIYSSTWSEAAAQDRADLCAHLSERFQELTRWWRQFAAHEVSNVDAIDASDAYHASEHVAGALNLWHRGGAATGDIRFWAEHAEMFDSPQAYALVINALLEQQDYAASRGLLIHWLSQAEHNSLEQGESSFHRLAERWMIETRQLDGHSPNDSSESAAAGVSPEQWTRMQKFLDFLEANAEHFWQVPALEIGAARGPTADPVDPFEESDDSEEEGELFRAAYEDVVFRDSADDGVEGEVFDTAHSSEDELLHESERLSQRLAFLVTLARLWRIVAASGGGRVDSASDDSGTSEPPAEQTAALARWIQQARHNRDELVGLLRDVQTYHIPAPLADHESMVEYERRRMVKETLLERIIDACVETANSGWLLAAAQVRQGSDQPPSGGELLEEEQLAVRAFAAIFRRDTRELRETVDDFIVALSNRPLLYVPLAKGGDPEEIVSVRTRQRCLQDLLKCLPRLGLIIESCQLIETARDMERTNPVGAGAVTEFDELFKTGFKALVNCLVTSAQTWGDLQESEGASERFQSFLVARLEELTESLLSCWLTHSKTLRLSVLEKVNEKRAWKRLVGFIERYGAELFTQRFLNIGNIRAILHQGAGEWLDALMEVGHGEIDLRLLDEIGTEISRSKAIGCLTLILEAIAENYGEYRDYNSTTTQSDRGELLYTLLDFLRLRARYDRVCWNLKPVVMAHEILVRRGHKRAAQTWRRALRERISDEADKFERNVVDLQTKHAMQMPSIADRVSERFVRPMIIDRICALVQPAVDEATQPGSKPTFRILQYEVDFLTREPSGVGFDVPAWLVALEDEVQQARQAVHDRGDFDELHAAVPAIQLAHEDIESQISEWTEQNR